LDGHEVGPLLGLSGGLKPAGSVDPWVARNAERLRSCVPATGADLAALVRQIGLEYQGGT
jgi:hypothetical protein